jgi:hypothetical protein
VVNVAGELSGGDGAVDFGKIECFGNDRHPLPLFMPMISKNKDLDHDPSISRAGQNLLSTNQILWTINASPDGIQRARHTTALRWFPIWWNFSGA